jgi:hypothetical protein
MIHILDVPGAFVLWGVLGQDLEDVAMGRGELLHSPIGQRNGFFNHWEPCLPLRACCQAHKPKRSQAIFQKAVKSMTSI